VSIMGIPLTADVPVSLWIYVQLWKQAKNDPDAFLKEVSSIQTPSRLIKPHTDIPSQSTDCPPFECQLPDSSHL
jgi:hypothetical protein